MGKNINKNNKLLNTICENSLLDRAIKIKIILLAALSIANNMY